MNDLLVSFSIGAVVLLVAYALVVIYKIRSSEKAWHDYNKVTEWPPAYYLKERQPLATTVSKHKKMVELKILNESGEQERLVKSALSLQNEEPVTRKDLARVTDLSQNQVKRTIQRLVKNKEVKFVKSKGKEGVIYKVTKKRA